MPGWIWITSIRFSIRRLSDKVHFVQLDDLDAQALERVGEAAFLTLQTSPGNHQAWIAVMELQGQEQTKDFSRRLRKGTGADHSASGATRVAGTTNYKQKYQPDFPTVQIENAHPGRLITTEQLETMGLVAPPKPATDLPAFTARTVQRSRGNKVWPDYARSVAGAPPSLQGDSPDRSMADFTWCMTAIDWGWSVEETARKLLEVSAKTLRSAPGYVMKDTL